MTSIIFLGLLIGSFIWGTIGDQLGRRRALILSLSMNAAFGLLSSISNNFIQLILFRFGSGIGVGGSIPLIFAYISEISPSRRKGYYLSILASSWMVSFFTVINVIGNKINFSLQIFSQPFWLIQYYHYKQLLLHGVYS